MGLTKHIALVGIIILALNSCKKSGTNVTKPKDTTTIVKDSTVLGVHIVGYTFNPDGWAIATYWHNGTPHILTNDIGSNAVSIATKGNDVLIVGFSFGGRADYWDNGVLSFLSDTSKLVSVGENSIYVNGNDVYVAGQINKTSLTIDGPTVSYPIYWKNGIAVSLPDYGFGGTAAAIIVQGKDVYVAGNVYINSFIRVVALWKNGVLSRFSTDNTIYASARSIAIKGNDVYIAGSIETTRAVSVATYWKNGVTNRLTDTLLGSNAQSMILHGNDIYIAGYNTLSNGAKSVATYWKNGVEVHLSTPGSTAVSITSQGNDVYIAGNNSDGKMCYWKNGAITEFTQYAVAQGITVVYQ